MFHYDRGLKLTKADLAIDFSRRQPRAFISHAHQDHMARHQFALCTPETARLYHLRLGTRAVLTMPYRQPVEWGGMTLTTYPAGHCLGSAMLLADDGEQTLLYTGDFKLGESATAERAELPHADTLVIESTYGIPSYRLMPRAEAVEMLIDLVRQTIARECTPVIQAYVLGKSQEVSKILTQHGIPVLQHPDIHAISKVYAQCGMDLGACGPYLGHAPAGHAVITPPGKHKNTRLAGLKNTVSFAVTGWAMHPSTKWRLGVDHAIPLSDHADYDELFQAVEQVGAKEIYCTHGPESFVQRLREAGFPAYRLGGTQQKLLNFD